MDVLYRLGDATARAVLGELSDPPSYSTVRTLLAVLERKGQVCRRLEGKAFIYRPSKPRAKVAASALRRLRDTFFDGSVEQVVSGLLDLKDTNLDAAELNRITDLIEKAKREGRA